jgi:S-adenosylmethionine hydrolase
MVLARAEENKQNVEFVHLDQPRYWLPEVSSVFHGRDVFAPSAAHLAAGVPLNQLGSIITDPIRLEIPPPIRVQHGWQAQVIHIDHFGNLATNLQASHLSQAKEVVIHIKDKEIFGLVSTFGERPPGELVALLDSSGSLAISVVNGDAAQFLNIIIGDKIEVLID